MDRKQKSEREPTTEERLCKKQKISPHKIKLSIGDTVILADKQKLTETSPYFDSLFRFHADADLEVVSLSPPDNVDLDCFLAVLNKISDMNAKLNITATNLSDYVALSKYFQVEQIEEECLTAFREMLPTLEMDNLLRLWRKGHARAIDKVTTLALVGISLKMDSASKSNEFLDCTVDELVALMSDDGFLPIKETDVCEAVKAWCNHGPENRKEKQVLQRVLAEVVWDDTTEHLIQSISSQCQKPDKQPKRAICSDGYEIPDNRLLKEFGAANGITVGQFLYCFGKDEGSGMSIGIFYRIDLNTKKREDLVLMCVDNEQGTGAVVPGYPSVGYKLHLIKTADGDKIGCFVSYLSNLGYTYTGGMPYHVADGIALYEITTGKWQNLPGLPRSRRCCQMVQCGSCLYVIGGEEYGSGYDSRGRYTCHPTHHCYRLHLDKLATTPDPEKEDSDEEDSDEEDSDEEDSDEEDPVSQWERIADLSVPRNMHIGYQPSVTMKCGRIAVQGSRAKTEEMDEDGDNANWTEVYDTTLNSWTAFKSGSGTM